MARREHDAYPTVEDLARAIVERIALYFPMPERVVEPTAGDGAFVRAAREVWPDAKIIAIDLVASHDVTCRAAGANRFITADARTVNYHGADLVLGNLPFNVAAAILRRIRETAPEAACAFLLPVGFQGRTQGRVHGKEDPALRRDAAFWRLARRVYSAPIHPRPSFTGDGKTDRMEYSLEGFGRSWDDGSVLGDPIVWRPEAGADEAEEAA